MKQVVKLWTSQISRSTLYRFNSAQFQKVPTEYTYRIEPIQSFEKIKAFRVIDLEGNVIPQGYENISQATLNKIYETMVKVEELDTIMYMSQRQGKVSFYMTSFGETAVTVGVGAALQDQDLIFPQYREQGTLIWRGFTIQEIINQCMGNSADLGKGRQMPVHYGSKTLNFVTVSSPLTTQVPQASGAGYGFRINKENRIAVTYFGEGAASEGDFHSAMNFASTLKSQTLFLCRNNHYAISTPTTDQFKGDTIAVKGPAYGMNTLKVDGNDVLAVVNAVRYAREYIITHQEPFLIEFITYRIGDHSTSDHSILYRDQTEIDSWKNENNPITRLGLYLKKSGKRNFNEDDDKILRKQVRDEVVQALKTGMEINFPPLTELFTDVYDKLTTNLVEQQQELLKHLEKNKEHYDLSRMNIK